MSSKFLSKRNNFNLELNIGQTEILAGLLSIITVLEEISVNK
jgi:hypothetical protein